MKKMLPLCFLLLLVSTIQAQVTFTAQGISTSGQNRAAVDMNGDFLDDLVSITATNINIQYQQSNGTFVEANINTTPADNTPSWSLAAGDYDANGYTDLVYGGGNGVTFMRANSDGTAYEEISYPQFVFSQRSNFVDMNNDGHMDLFMCHDVEPNVYYINDGNGNLTYFQGGIGDFPTGGHYGSVWIDVDNDGDIDMFNAKCGGGPERSSDELHLNDGNGNFTEVGAAAGLRDPMQTWSSAWADYDNDGDMDCFVGNSTTSNGHKLTINNGDGTFTDISVASGVTALAATGIENCTYDFNNDGFADILSNGNILLNNGDLTFSVVPNVLPSNNGSLGDLNGDGFIDAFTGSTIYYNNAESGNNYLVINTVGVQSNINGIGAKVTVTSDLGTQIREVRSGEGFRYMSTLNTHFGLGQDTVIDEIVIEWPSGVIDVLNDVAVNQVINVLEGSFLGTNDTEVNSLITYPNPTDGVLNLSVTNEFNNPFYTIIGVDGRLVASSKLTSKTIDVSNLAAGNYILRVYDASQSFTQKFIKR